MNPLKRSCQLHLSRGSVGMFFGMTLVYLVGMPLFSHSWLRENNGPALTPNVDYRLQWISDADFQGLDRTGEPEYASENGRTTYVAGATWQTFRPYYVSSPDGKWHLMVGARGPMTPYALRSYLGAAVPVAMFSTIGLIICLFGRKSDSCSGAKGPDRSFEALE